MKYSIDIYKNGSSNGPGPELFFLNEWGKEFNLYTYVYVIKGNDSTIVLDTGCGDIEAFNQMLFEAFGGKIKFNMPEDEKIEGIINKTGLDAEKVDYVILSHLHFDHSSNVRLFPNAKVVLSKKGLFEFMKKERPYYYDSILFPTEPVEYVASLPSDKVILIEDEQEIMPGIKVFWVGGHTPGCIATEVDTKKGKVVFSTDIAPFLSNIERNIPTGLFYDLWECYEAYEKIRDRADIIIPGHDPATLDKHFREGKI